MRIKKRKAFTIIELIVVIAVIGILVLLAMPRFLGYVEKSQVTVIRHDVKVAEGKLAESLINGPTEFKSWDNNAKDLDGLVEERKLYETEGLVKKVEDGGGVEYNEETEDFTDYKIIPKSMRKEIGTKLKGEFYANSGGKVYYERDKAAKADKPEKEDTEVDENGCPIGICGKMIPIDIPYDRMVPVPEEMQAMIPMEEISLEMTLSMLLEDAPPEMSFAVEAYRNSTNNKEYISLSSVNESGPEELTKVNMIVEIDKFLLFFFLSESGEEIIGDYFYNTVIRVNDIQAIYLTEQGNSKLMPTCSQKYQDGKLIGCPVEYGESAGGITDQENIIEIDGFVYASAPGRIKYEQEGPGTGVNISYLANSIIGYTGNEMDMVIPNTFTIDGVVYPVEHIGPYAFAQENITYPAFYDHDSPRISSVSLPDSLLTIGENAFKGHLLTELTLPINLHLVGEHAFRWNKITRLDINDSLNTISSFAFEDNKIEEVIMPDNLVNIGRFAFQKNEIANIRFSNQINEINEYTFNNNKLTELTIPNHITEIGDNAFSYNQITNLVMHDNVEIIGKEAFSRNLITDVEIPENLTSLGYGAFFENKITNVVFNDLLETIGQTTFYKNNLSSLIIPDNIKNIGQRAFADNPLNDITISDNVSLSTNSYSVSEPFHKAYNLNNKKAGRYKSNEDGTAWGDYHTFPYGIEEVTSTTGRIVSYVGSHKDVVIPNEINGLTITHIGKEAFQNIGLNSVILPSTLEMIEGDTFQESDKGAFRKNNITSIIFPEGLVSIGNSAFRENKLTTVSFPSSVTKIDGRSFQANLITNINFSDTYIKLDRFSFSNNKLTSIVIPNNIDITNPGIFRGNQITSIGFPDGITYIGIETFANNKIENLVLPSTVKGIGRQAFSSNPLKTLSLNQGLETIGERAFEYSELASLILPNSLKSIDSRAFLDDKGPIKSITVGSNLSISTIFAAYESRSTSMFYTTYINGGRQAGTYTRGNCSNWYYQQ